MYLSEAKYNTTLYHVKSQNCCLIGIVLAVRMKKYPPVTMLSNICEYCLVPNQHHSNRNVYSIWLRTNCVMQLIV